MANYSLLCAKIIKITALVLAFLLLVKTFLCFLLSFAILEEPPKEWPQRLKDDCYPRWYGWFSLILNSFGVVVYYYMYFGILNTNKRNLYIGLVGVTGYLTTAVLTHLVMWAQGAKPQTMIKLNWIGTGISVICSPLSYLHYRRIIANERNEVMNTEKLTQTKLK
ncbi:uncharacterized protein LOC129245926 [Anastrepha obliqua]|uniref:uncharacterized protein LOC129245926 n=1 Tax=Anastrepha obliqua TaxID=95512 RepID=UPI0024094EBA|nr:uncharacterized protein LOC129245926 [Anastrepha obliqua]